MLPFGKKDISSGDLSKYATTYLENFTELNNFIRDFPGQKTAMSVKSLDNLDDHLRASVVLSDLTSLTMSGGKKATVVMPKHGQRTVVIPTDYLKEHDIDLSSPELHVGFFQPIDKEHKSFVKSLLPVIERGWLVLRPSRLVMIKTGEKSWQTFDVEPDSSDDHWIVSGETQSLGEIPARIESNSHIPFDLALPYLRGVTWLDFIKIIEDSADTISNLRLNLRQAISKVSTTGTQEILELRRDLIEPEIDTLQRKFKKAIASHKFSIAGASVGIVSMSLSAILTGGATSAVCGLLGAGGLGLLSKEYSSYRGKLEEMKDSPFYLFWQLRRKIK